MTPPSSHSARDLLARVFKATENLRLSSTSVVPGRFVYATKGPGYVEFVREELETKRIADAFRKLCRGGYVTSRERKGHILVLLTKKGRIAGLRLQAAVAKKLRPGERCVVSFDFPMSAGRSRDAFRYLLKTLGFRQEHFSLWTHECDVFETMRALLLELGLGRWVSLYRGHAY